MLRGRCLTVVVAVVASQTFVRPAMAQEHVSLRTDTLFYADNTEYFNPFRDGETLFGVAATVAVDVVLSDRATFSGGVFLNTRHGDEAFAETVRPVFSLTLEGPRQRFVLGTLVTDEGSRDFEFDRNGPHGLLPPLQRETLAWTRLYEAGLQWTVDVPSLQQDFWVNWQATNTAAHRERFDVGVTGRAMLSTTARLSAAYQFHLVHEGGQLFSNGPVRDSWAVGPGVVVEPSVWFLDHAAVEGYAMFSRFVPDRATSLDGSHGHGHGVFTRLTGQKNGWRGHLIVWGACDWIKVEGDANYGSLRQDGTVFEPTRHYGEIGLTKTFYTADGVELEGSARVHRVEKDYDYSYRVLARVDFDFPVWSR